MNFVVTLKTWLESASPAARLHFISIEKHPVAPSDMARLARRWPELQPHYDELVQCYPPPLPGMHLLELAGGSVRLHLLFDDIEPALDQLDYQVDAWYLDGFAPSRNPAMWTDRAFELIARHTAIGGTVATYTAAGAVRRRLRQAGFVVQKTRGFGSKRDMLSGFLSEQRCYLIDQPWFARPEFSSRRQHAAVIGAGLAGLAVAWALVKRGWRVTLVDKHADVAGGASGNPAGIVMPRVSRLPNRDARFYLNAFVHAIHCLDRLQAQTDAPFWFRSGSVLVDDEAKLQQMHASHEFDERFIRLVARDSTQKVTGMDLNSDALLFVDAGWVDVKRLCEAIRDVCGDALTCLQADVVDLHSSHGAWNIVDQDGDMVLSSECTIVASGAESKHFAALQWLPVDSVRGQLTIAPQTNTSHAIRCALSAERYITPGWRGRHVVGASYRPDDPSALLSDTDHQANIAGINRLLPGLLDRRNELAGRVAFRAVSQDRVPVAGGVPDVDAFNSAYHDLRHGRPANRYPAGVYLPGLYISTAHGSRGLVSCFLCGEVIAAMICGEPLPAEKAIVDYLNPARFIIRRLKRRPG